MANPVKDVPYKSRQHTECFDECWCRDLSPYQHVLMERTMLLPPCGCTIDGNGTLPHPIRIVFCPAHLAVKAGVPAGGVSSG